MPDSVILTTAYAVDEYLEGAPAFAVITLSEANVASIRKAWSLMMDMGEETVEMRLNIGRVEWLAHLSNEYLSRPEGLVINVDENLLEQESEDVDLRQENDAVFEAEANISHEELVISRYGEIYISANEKYSDTQIFARRFRACLVSGLEDIEPEHIYLARYAGKTPEMLDSVRRNNGLEWVNFSGDTALLAAARVGNAESVTALLNEGADIDARDRSGLTVNEICNGEVRAAINRWVMQRDSAPVSVMGRRKTPAI